MASYKALKPYQTNAIPKIEGVTAPKEVSVYNRVLLGLSQLFKRKDGIKDNDEIIAERFKWEGSYIDVNENSAYFTCPVGKRAYFAYLIVNMVHTGIAGTDMGQLTINTQSGSMDCARFYTYAAGETKTIVISPPQGIVLEAGESIYYSSDALARMQISGFGYYFPL